MGLYCFWQSCANVSFISSFKDYFSSHKVVRGKAAQHTITIQRKCWDWKNNKLGCCRPQHVARGTCPGQHPSNWIILLTPARPHVYIYQLDKLSSAQTRARTEHPISQATPARWSLTPDCWLYYVSWCPHLPRVSCPRGHWSLPLDQNELGSGRLELYIWVSWVQNQIVVIYGGAWSSPAQPSPAQPSPALSSSPHFLCSRVTAATQPPFSIELETNIREVWCFTTKEMLLTRAFSWFQVATQF